MISPERKNIEEILGGTRIKYTVPNYQRAYNWGMTPQYKTSTTLANPQHLTASLRITCSRCMNKLFMFTRINLKRK